ncbi:SET domain-containing protein [Microvirga roseola]|uniref:SET domain-containing protein n=1 Tax=Microvirga roseola TaxID=2883126 RepID=UPI003898E5CD
MQATLEGRFRVGRSETGLGLFATEVIEKGTFIIEYLGPRISSEEVHRRRSTRYLFEVNSRWTIDGSPRWNTARYINHSCRPNAQAVVSRGRIRIEAIRRIRPGDEITYNYGRNYFDIFIRPTGCKCQTCRTARSKRLKVSHRR